MQLASSEVKQLELAQLNEQLAIVQHQLALTQQVLLPVASVPPNLKSKLGTAPPPQFWAQVPPQYRLKFSSHFGLIPFLGRKFC